MDSRTYPFGYCQAAKCNDRQCVRDYPQMQAAGNKREGEPSEASPGLASSLQYLNASKLEKEVRMASNGLSAPPEAPFRCNEVVVAARKTKPGVGGTPVFFI